MKIEVKVEVKRMIRSVSQVQLVSAGSKWVQMIRGEEKKKEQMSSNPLDQIYYIPEC